MTWQSEADKHVNTPVLFVTIAWNSGTLYYSNQYVRETGRLWKGNIIKFPELRGSIGDIKRSYEKSRISLIINDTDYAIHTLEEDEAVGPKTINVTIELGFEEDDFANKETLYTGRIFDFSRLHDLLFQIDIAEKSRTINNKYPDLKIDLGNCPNAHVSALNITIAVPYGTISALALDGKGAFGYPALKNQTGLPFIDITVDGEQHMVGKQTAAITVDRVYKNGVLQTAGGGNDYQISTRVIGTFTFTEIHWEAGNNPTEDDYITCDITFGSRRPVEGFRHFMENNAYYVGGDFNAALYAAAITVEANRLYDYAGAFFEQKTLKQLMDEFRDDWEVDIFWNKSGEVCFKYLSASAIGTPNEYTDELDILDRFNSDPQANMIMNYLDYEWNFNGGRDNYYSTAARQDTDSQTQHGGTYTDYKGFRFTRDTTVAGDIAYRKLLRLRNPIDFTLVSMPLKTFSDELSDVIRITHFAGKGTAGYVRRLMQIRRYQINPEKMTNDMLLWDAEHFVGGACIMGNMLIMPASWLLASLPWQRDYCYMCDKDTGEFSNGEPGKRMLD
jgi:hypothetical protein